MIVEALAFGAAAAGVAAAAELRPRRSRAARAPFGILGRAGRSLLPRTAGGPVDLERRLVEAGRPGGIGRS